MMAGPWPNLPFQQSPTEGLKMSAHDGKTAALSFSIQPPEFSGSHTWVAVGMLRTKSMEGTWDTADSTADSTPNSAKTVLATRRSFSFSGDGVSYDDAAYHQRTLKNHFHNPGSTTGNRPEIWFKLAFASGESYIGPFVITTLSEDAPEADVCTWSIAATSNGLVTYDDGVA